jgi:hypothetical protein
MSIEKEKHHLSDKDRYICIIALSNLDSLLEAPDPALNFIADQIRKFLTKHDITTQDIKDLAVKFGVPEKTVFKAGFGLE